MSRLTSLNPRRRGTSAWISIPVVVAAIMTLALVGPASAATVMSTWTAKVGTAGANGTARVQAYSSGSGALTLKLVKLRKSSVLPVVISKGSCSSTGATLMTLSSIKTTSIGAATRTSSLTASQIKAVKAATKGSGKIAIRIGSGTARKCGQFVLVPPVVVSPPAAVAATIPVGVYPGGLALDSTSAWVANTFDRSVSRIDRKTNAVLSVTPIVLPGNLFPVGAATGFGAVWVTFEGYDDSFVNQTPGVVQRMDPITGALIGNPIPVGREPSNIAVSPEAVWVSNRVDGSVSRIDPTLAQVTATIAIGGYPYGLAAGFGAVWVANEADGKVMRIDPATNQVTATIQTQLNAEAVAIGAGSVWVTNYGAEDQPNGTVTRIDPVANAVVAVVPAGINPGFIAFGGGYAWVAMVGEATVLQIDPAKNAVKTRLDVGAKSWGIAAGDHAVWVTHPTAAGADPMAFLPGTVTRINF